jgi:transposase
MLPKDLPPWQTVYAYFRDWGREGTLDRIHSALRERVRTKREGRGPSPSAGIVDSQSVKGADTVPAATRGYDAAKKVNGRKRHIVVDTIGLLLIVMITAASIQDRDGGRALLKRLSDALASVRHVFADGGYQGKLVATAKSAWGIAVEVVRKPADQRGFAVLPRRWVVERTFSWLMRFRRLVRDYERLPETHAAMVKWAMVGIMLNRLAPPPGPRPWSRKGTRE